MEIHKWSSECSEEKVLHPSISNPKKLRVSSICLLHPSPLINSVRNQFYSTGPRNVLRNYFYKETTYRCYPLVMAFEKWFFGESLFRRKSRVDIRESLDGDMGMVITIKLLAYCDWVCISWWNHGNLRFAATWSLSSPIEWGPVNFLCWIYYINWRWSGH